MSEKKTQQEKPFDPIAKAVDDAIDRGFFGDASFNMQKFCANCARRGIIGKEAWTQKALSTPLKLFQQASKDMGEDQIDTLLNGLATTIGFDPNLIKRHFYAIKFGVEEQFLVALEQKEKERKKLERLAEEAETEAPTEEKAEESEEEEE
jgi:hypothetical protein